MFTDRPCDGFFHCFHWSEMHDLSERAAPTSVFPDSLPTWTTSEVCAVCAHLAAPSHFYLVVYTYNLGVRRLSIILGSGGSIVSFAHTTSSSQFSTIVFVYLIYEVYI